MNYWYTYLMVKAHEARFFVFTFCICFLGILSVQIQNVNALQDYATIASPVLVEGVVNNHDVISYGSEENVFRASRSFADESMFGVIVDDPVLYMDSQTFSDERARPVVRYGEVIVNVSTLGGDIEAGDIITTSIIPGVAQKTVPVDASYILGFALEAVTLNGESVVYDGREIFFGTVPITLRIGPYLTKEGVAFVASGKDYDSILEDLKNSGVGAYTEEVDKNAISAFKVFRYALAALVAITALVVSVSRFGDTFKQGVVSIGRNPLARSQIRSILFWNVLLIVLVTGAGLGIAAAIILMP